jgi:hypothetical protein
MTDIIHFLKEFGELAHWTTPAREDEGGNPTCPPIITWRYKTPSNEAASFFQRELRAVPGTVAWELSVYGQNCVLMPARINEYSKAHGGLGGWAVAEELMNSDPAFGRRANAELPLLVAYLEQQLAQIRSAAR